MLIIGTVKFIVETFDLEQYWGNVRYCSNKVDLNEDGNHGIEVKNL